MFNQFFNCGNSSEIEKLTRLDGNEYYRLSFVSLQTLLGPKCYLWWIPCSLVLSFVDHCRNPWSFIDVVSPPTLDYSRCLAYAAGISISTRSQSLRGGLGLLLKTLKTIPEARLACEMDHLVSLGEMCGDVYGEVMRGCCIITDRSLHPLKKELGVYCFFFDGKRINLDLLNKPKIQ